MASFGDYNRVNTNVTAMDARLSLNKINKELGDSRLKLSTGFKINNAEDDAAGFAIATKLKSRVAGLEQGLQNVSDAKSVLDVAEGAYSTVVDNLIEMKSLATQAANGTIAVGSDEMKYIASQLEALAKDINDIAKSTTYNGIDLMDSAQSLTFQVGEGTGDTMAVDLKKVNMASLFNTAGSDATLTASEVLGATSGGGTSDDYTYDGTAPTTGQTGEHLFNAIDADLSDSGAEVNYATGDDVLSDATLFTSSDDVVAGSSALTDGDVDDAVAGTTGVTGFQVEKVAGAYTGSQTGVDGSGSALADGKKYVTVVDNSGADVATFDPTGIEVDTGASTNKVTEVTTSQIKSGGYIDVDGVNTGFQVADSSVTGGSGGNYTVLDTSGNNVTTNTTTKDNTAQFDGSGIQIIDASAASNTLKTVTSSDVKTGEATLTGGSGETILVREDDTTANSSLLFIDEDKVNGADMRAFIGHIDSAIGKMNEYTNQIGIDQRSLSNKEVNLSEAITSNSAARSRIMDTDFAKEQSNSIRLQILQQTATAALSQANMGPQAVLSFLG